MTALGSEHPELDAFREAFRAFIDHDVRPLAGRLAGSGPAPEKVFQVAGENGFLGICAPEEEGGGGSGDLSYPLLAAGELAAAGLPGVALAYATHAAVAVPLAARCLREGSRRARWLPLLASGAVLAAVPGGVLRLVPAGDGLVLDGRSDVTPNATRARLLIAAGRTDSGEPRLVLVPADTAGTTVTPVHDALGVPGADLGVVEFRAVSVGDGQILSADGADLTAARSDERLALAAIATAGARASLVQTLEYVRGRKAFGQPIASFQNTRYRLARFHADLIIAEAYLTVCTADRAAGNLSAERAAAAAVYCAELFTAAADQCLQLHGGYGYMREYPISQAFADASYLRMHAGGDAAAQETLASGLGL